MSVTTKRGKKNEQEQAEKRAAFREMAQALEGELKQGKHTERLAKAAQQAPGLERYSPLNQLLILTQCPQATETAGYVEWKNRGFHVRKGEHGIAIRAPHVKGGQEDGEGAGIGFHRVYVFDVSQVDPIPPSEEAQEPEAAVPAAVE